MKRRGREVGERHEVLKIILGGDIEGNGTILVVIREEVVGRVDDVDNDCHEKKPKEVATAAAIASVRRALLDWIHFFISIW